MSVLLEVKDLKKHFPLTKGILRTKQIGLVKAVDGVSFSMGTKETLGLVGESGCGKTTTGRCIVGLENPTAGRITFEGKEMSSFNGVSLRKLKAKTQVIFQDPFGSLDPRLRIADII
ncbi:unnamed protein product, partial [marine sediment metagenome]